MYEGTSAWPVKAVAIVAALLGIASVVIGLGGIMIWRSKREWLYKRLVTERTRQFHFQTFVCRVRDVMESFAGQVEKTRFVEERKKWLAAFKLRFEQKSISELAAVLKTDGSSGVWVHTHPWPSDPSLLETLPDDFFQAYRELRIRHQLQYADWKLREEQSLFVPGGMQRLERVMTNVSLFAILILFFTHLVVAISVPVGGRTAFGGWTYLVVIWCAIAALAARALEEGLQPKQELERYRRYRASVQDILRRFEGGRTGSEKFDTMIEMERLAYLEMCDFIRASHEARFVI